ncbi:hypothetical protein [Myxococcus sp. SDU36]|uniref:hypothetical protein n=1 Tax=Myxococcus sp. SDU36 TaxID=2831967 RepID=UPI002542F2FC|nr:hypothetical protein [Myxococcus sp. SDU36]WIG98431.1 hypothetical protein KGD87_14170 [Myxococcus sp. SDU36]
MRSFPFLVLLVAGAAAALPPNEGGELAYVSALLYSPDSVDAMSMECRPTAAAQNSLSEVDCVFSHLLVTKAAPPTPHETAAGAAELRKRYAGDEGVRKAHAHCRSGLAYLNEVQTITKEPSKLAYLRQEQAALRRVCECSSSDCVVSAMREVLIEPRSACSVTHTRFERTLKRKAKNRWVSVSGPEGLCGVVLTLVLTYDLREEDWTYTQTRVVTAEDATCQKLASKITAHSHHRYLRSALMNCETIKTLLP